VLRTAGKRLPFSWDFAFCSGLVFSVAQADNLAVRILEFVAVAFVAYWIGRIHMGRIVGGISPLRLEQLRRKRENLWFGPESNSD
jgi:hypothetical protein